MHKLLTSQTPFLELDHRFSEFSETMPDSTIFEPEIDMVALYKYCQGEIGLPIEILQNFQVEKDGIDFVRSLLTPNPKGRPTAAEALQNPWLAMDGYTNDWYQTLEHEFSHLGVNLGPGRRERVRLIKQTYETDIMEFLPASAKFPNLLEQAAANGLNLVFLMLIKSPSGGKIDYRKTRRIFEGAMKAGQLDTIKLFLNNLADFNVHTNPHVEGQSLLQWAVEAGHYETVKLLLDNKVGVNTSTKREEAFLSFVDTGDVGIARLLFENESYANVSANGKIAPQHY